MYVCMYVCILYMCIYIWQHTYTYIHIYITSEHAEGDFRSNDTIRFGGTADVQHADSARSCECVCVCVCTRASILEVFSHSRFPAFFLR
jgi:hypothetical protein